MLSAEKKTLDEEAAMSTQIQTAIRHNGSEAGPRVNPSAVSGHTLGIVLATFMGGWHVLWSLLVLFGWAQRRSTSSSGYTSSRRRTRWAPSCPRARSA